MLRMVFAAVLAVSTAAAMSKPAPESPVGAWLAVDIGGTDVLDGAPSTIEIKPDGSVAGSGGCNRISGKAEITGDAIRFGPMIATKMACAPALMEQEGKFLAALAAAASWRLDAGPRTLTLLDRSGASLVSFSAL